MPSAVRVVRLLLAAALLLVGVATAQESNDTITVYKSPGCGCCEKWAEHLRAAGFRVDARDAANLNAVRRELGVPSRLAGCHTAKVGRYVVEGHVPADQIKRLLQEQPDIAGISVPGMPVGSPGMGGSGGREYDVVSWDKAGRTRRFATVPPLFR
jgi:hypothetical protein